MSILSKAPMIPVVLLGVQLSVAYGQNTPQTGDTGALPGNDIGTGSSLPKSPYVSNITPRDMKSTIAPTAPEPNVGPNANVQQLLMAGGQAIKIGQTGTANEALEQAETRILTRSAPQSQMDYTSHDLVVSKIDQARTALGAHNDTGAVQIIDQILASHAPELSD